MATEKQIDAATDAYLKARGWDDEMIKSHQISRNETRERMVAALKAAEEAGDVQDQG
jgi:hypothetical protein